MKKTIRMNERELNRLISESVKRVLKESLENDIDSLSSPIDKTLGTYDARWPIDDKEDQNRYSWEELDNYNRLIKDRGKYLDSYKQKNGSDFSLMRDYLNPKDYEFASDLKKDWDNKYKSQKERNKYEKSADSRPLHRKGSANRELMDMNRKRDR